MDHLAAMLVKGTKESIIDYSMLRPLRMISNLGLRSAVVATKYGRRTSRSAKCSKP